MSNFIWLEVFPFLVVWVFPDKPGWSVSGSWGAQLALQGTLCRPSSSGCRECSAASGVRAWQRLSRKEYCIAVNGTGRIHGDYSRGPVHFLVAYMASSDNSRAEWRTEQGLLYGFMWIYVHPTLNVSENENVMPISSATWLWSHSKSRQTTLLIRIEGIFQSMPVT